MKNPLALLLVFVFIGISVFGQESLVTAKEAVDFGPPVLPTVSRADFEIWVAPDGNDAAVGSVDAPLATLSGSIAAVRKIRQANPNASVTVFFRGGRYAMTETAIMEDLNGTVDKPILFRSAPGEKPVFTGGVTVGGRERDGGWQPLTDSTVWREADDAYRARFDAAAVDSILTASLAEAGIDDFGSPANYGKRMEFFYDGVPQTLARWPNVGFATAGKALGATPVESHGQVGAEEGIFEGAPDQPRDWNAEKEGYLFGYWFWDWAESFQKLEGVDPETGVVRQALPYHGYGYKDGLRYYGFNLLCELNAPGEFFIDREKKVLYWIPPCPEFLDFAEPRGSLSRFAKPYMVEIRNSSHVILAGLEFTEGRDCAVSVIGGDSVLLTDLTIRRFGRDAIHVNGGTNHGIFASTLETLGCGGITITGGDRKTLTPANHFVENSVVRNFSRIKRTYAPAILAQGCGMRFGHNHFTESSSSAMRMEGNDLLVELNRFDNLVTESDDQGGIDVFYNPTYRGNVIRWNYWENIVGGTRCGAAAVRFDDIICGFTVKGNVFVNCGGIHFGAVQIHGGKDNVVENNVFLNSRAAVSFSPWGEERYGKVIRGEDGHGAVLDKLYKEVDIRSELWLSRYPDLAHLTENPDANTVVGNLLLHCDDAFLHDRGVNRIEKNTVLDETKPLAEILRPEFLARYGLEPIPMDQIGPTGVKFLQE